MSARPARDSETPFISVNFCEPVSRNCPLLVRLDIHGALEVPEQAGAYCTSSMMTGGG